MNITKSAAYFKFKDVVKVKKPKRISANLYSPNRSMNKSPINYRRKVPNYNILSNNSLANSLSDNYLLNNTEVINGEPVYQVPISLNQLLSSNAFKNTFNSSTNFKQDRLTIDDLKLKPLHKLSTEERQELIDISQCTFKPKILNKSFEIANRPGDVFENLHNKQRLNTERSRRKMMNYMMTESKECTFTPNMNKKRSLSFSNFMYQSQNVNKLLNF